MERARYNTELCSNPGPLLNNVKPSNFWGSHQYDSVFDFIEDVASSFTEIKEGRDGSYLLEKGDSHHNTLFIALSKEGDYWKVISGGVFRIRYSKNKKIIHSASEVRTSPPAEDELLPFEENNQQDSSNATGNSSGLSFN